MLQSVTQPVGCALTRVVQRLWEARRRVCAACYWCLSPPDCVVQLMRVLRACALRFGEWQVVEDCALGVGVCIILADCWLGGGTSAECLFGRTGVHAGVQGAGKAAKQALFVCVLYLAWVVESLSIIIFFRITLVLCVHLL